MDESSRVRADAIKPKIRCIDGSNRMRLFEWTSSDGSAGGDCLRQGASSPRHRRRPPPPPASHLVRPPPPFVTISVCGRRPAPISVSLPSATSHICRPPPPPAPSSIREHRSPLFSSELQRRYRLPPPPFSSYLHCLHLPSPPSASSPFLSPSTTTFVRSCNSAPSSHLAAAALSVDLDSNRRLLSSCQQICFGVLVSSRKAMVLRAVAARLASSSLCHHHVLQAALLAPTSTSPTAFLHSHATSFGYKQVREDEKSKLVGNVFSSVASSYDVMNDLMSGGLHRLWKDRLISKLNPFPGMKHLDVAGGTGDVAFRVAERIKSVSHRATQGTLTDLEEDTHIYVCDINPNMLDVGKKRAAEKGYNEEHCLSWVQGDAEALSFDDGSMDGYTIAFGIRNVTHIEKALSETYRVLKKGGRFLCLELSHVDVPIFKDIYDVYSFSVIPAVGELVAGDRQSYQYLVESIRRFPKQEKFAQMIQEAGFERVEYENLVGGIVAIHSGLKL